MKTNLLPKIHESDLLISKMKGYFLNILLVNCVSELSREWNVESTCQVRHLANLFHLSGICNKTAIALWYHVLIVELCCIILKKSSIPSKNVSTCEFHTHVLRVYHSVMLLGAYVWRRGHSLWNAGCKTRIFEKERLKWVILLFH